MGIRCTVCCHPRLSELEALLAQGVSGTEVAARFGLQYNAVYRHKANHAAKRIAKAAEKRLAKATSKGLAALDARIAAKEDRWSKIQKVFDERAADPTMQSVPGGSTGLLIRRLKSIGNGLNARTVEEYEVDTAALAEARQLEESAAKDLGQWTPQGDDDVRQNAQPRIMIVLPQLLQPAQDAPTIDLQPRSDIPGLVGSTVYAAPDRADMDTIRARVRELTAGDDPEP